MNTSLWGWIIRWAQWFVHWFRIPVAALALAVLIVWGLVRFTDLPVPDLIRQFLVARGLGPPPEPIRTDAVHKWLTCADCTERDLDSVLAIARWRPDSILDVLNTALLDGPDAYEKRTLRHALLRIHARDSRYLATHDTALHLPPVWRYVSDRLSRLRTSWSARAAIAIGQIGTRSSCAMLDSARAIVSDPVVRRAIEVAPDSAFVRGSLRRGRGVPARPPGPAPRLCPPPP